MAGLTWLVLATAATAAAIAVIATGIVRGYANLRLVDEVNDRSSHSRPTPRGGGAGLLAGAMLTWGGVMTWITAVHGSPEGLVVNLFVDAIVLIAIVGWIDDHRGLPRRVRLSVQVLAGALAVAATTGWSLDTLTIAGWTVFIPGWVVAVLGLVGVIWMINLTNFMDGIDGLAAGQGLVGFSAIGLLLAVADPSAATEISLFAAFAGACLGFLFWNWPPARIFMGDIGSTALGLTLAVGILSGIARGLDLLILSLPVAPSVVDATATLVRRLLRRERIVVAHRSHLYQRMALRLGAHAVASSCFIGFGILGGVLALLTQNTEVLNAPTAVGIWAVAYIALTILGRIIAPTDPDLHVTR